MKRVSEKPNSVEAAPLQLPENCRDVTAQQLGTVVAIIGAEQHRKTISDPQKSFKDRPTDREHEP
jgi:hypothetical protein